MGEWVYIYIYIYIYIYPLKSQALRHTDYAYIYIYMCTHLYIYIYIYIYKSKWVTVVEGDSKAPFLISTTPRCRGECYSFPGIAPLYPRLRRFQIPFFESLV